MASVRHICLALIALVALSWPGFASASHGAADEQLEMTHLANSPKDDTTNTDIAFWGDLAYSGYTGGFRIIDVANRSQPAELVDYACPGSQNDVGVWDTGTRRLLFLSVDGQRADDNCAQPAPAPPVGPQVPSGEENFEGIRVFDVTNPAQPVYLKAVFTDCGSHTQTVIPVRRQADGSFVIDQQNPDRVFLYVSSYVLTGASPLRCPDTQTGEGQVVDPTHNKISIVEVPFAAPEQADVLKEVALNPQTLPFEADPLSRGCHDIGVFLELELAVAACQGEGQVWDISNPAKPDTMGAQRIFNENINYWHSASFTWDGKYLIFGDEEGGAAITHGCLNLAEQQPFGTGATWFYQRAALTDSPYSGPAAGNFVQDRQQLSQGGTICTAHNYNAIPVDDRYLLVSAYYEAGTSVLDFTDVSRTKEIAYFDAAGGDVNPDGHENPNPDTWSSYWYRGNIFANDINRGLDVFGLTGEPATLTAGARALGHLNPQTQERMLAGPPGPSCRGADATILGTAGPDQLAGTENADVILGRGGDDEIKARGARDVICGQGGSDRLRGNTGSDQIFGGKKHDRVAGGKGADRLRGNTGRDRVGGGKGADRLIGNGGKDRLGGGKGADRLRGGAGHDLLRGGAGRDRCAGGPGRDRPDRGCD